MYYVYKHSNLDVLAFYYDKPPVLITDDKSAVTEFLGKHGAVPLLCGSKFRKEWVNKFQMKIERMETINVVTVSRPGKMNLFHDYADHPRVLVKLNNKLSSTAAGRYQILKRIFDHYKQSLSLSDFSMHHRMQSLYNSSGSVGRCLLSMAAILAWQSRRLQTFGPRFPGQGTASTRMIWPAWLPPTRLPADHLSGDPERLLRGSEKKGA